MSGAPSRTPGGNGNGSRSERYEVKTSCLFDKRWRTIEFMYPGLRTEHILAWLRLRLRMGELRYIARKHTVGQRTWFVDLYGGVASTGEDIPPMYVLLTVASGVITLQDVHTR